MFAIVCESTFNVVCTQRLKPFDCPWRILREQSLICFPTILIVGFKIKLPSNGGENMSRQCDAVQIPNLLDDTLLAKRMTFVGINMDVLNHRQRAYRFPWLGHTDQDICFLNLLRGFKFHFEDC